MEPCLQLALRWQEHNHIVMFKKYSLEDSVKESLIIIADHAPYPLVIIKAWEISSGALQFPEEAKVLKKTSSATWLHRCKGLNLWLKEKKGLSMEERKKYDLQHLPSSIIWQPLVKTKSEQRQYQGFPEWVKDAFNAVLFILAVNEVPLTTSEITEQCQGVYSEKTIRNALNKLKAHKLASAIGSIGERRSWMLTEAGKAVFNCNY